MKSPLHAFIVIIPVILLFPAIEAGIWDREFLLIGQVFPQECPVPGWLNQEPGLRYRIIPTDTDGLGLSDEDSRRFVRQYFPRTKKEFYTTFQFVVMPDTRIAPFTGKQIMWMKESFEGHDVGCLVSVGADLAGNYEQEWINSPLHDVLPTSLKEQYRVGDTFKIVILKDDPPVLSMFRQYDIESFQGSCPCSRNHPKEGSTTWADANYLTQNLQYPWLVSWQLGTTGGHIWTASDDLDHQWWWPGGMRFQSTNPYSGDVFLNIVYYSTGRKLPTDIDVVHQLRTNLGLYETQRLMIRGTIEWAEKLGANVNKAERALGDVEGIYKRALVEYSEGEYGIAVGSLDEAMMEAELALEIAFKTKQEAMFYIYAVEWLATTGTLMISGSVIYTLMIRRRLYREVETTRYLETGQ